jgi:hypothetical protein
MSAAVAIALHIFHVTRAFLAWQTVKREPGVLREVCKFFLSQTRSALSSVRQAQKTPLRQAKIQKYSTRYIKTGNPGLYCNKHPKNLNILHRRRKRVFREKEKTVKKTLIRVLVVLALMALGSTTVLADGGNLPPCPPKILCSVSR